MYVKMRNINFKYTNAETETLKNINFEVEKGKVLAVLGESGSGKSTILRLLAGFEKPRTGRIEINDELVVDEERYIPPEKRKVGMVFQDYALFPHMTVEKNISFGLNKENKDEKKNRVKEVLKLVDMEGYGKRYPYELSGGQQQRVALARSLAPNPELILLDEPFSNLDAELKGKIRKELKNILKKAEITTLFVTHDKEDVLETADQLIVLHNGEISLAGKEPAKLLTKF